MKDNRKPAGGFRDGELDAFLRAAPTALPDPALLDRLKAGVRRRLDRRRRVRAAGWIAGLGAAFAAAILLSVIPPAWERRKEIAPSPAPGRIPAVAEETPVPAVNSSPTAFNPLEASLHRLRSLGPEAIAELAAAAVGEPGDRAAQAAGLLVSLRTSEANEAVMRLLAGSPDSAAAGAALQKVFDRPSGEAASLSGKILDSGHPRLEGRAVRILAGRSPRDAARAFWRICRRRLEAAPGGGGMPERFLAACLPGLDRRAAEMLAADAGRGLPGKQLLEGLAAALGESGLPEAWPLLAAVLDAVGPEPAVLAAAGALGDPRAVPALRRWILIPDRRGIAAVSALGRIPGPGALGELLAAYQAARGELGDLSPRLRGEIAAALRGRRDEAVASLRSACRADPGREAALGALVELFPREAGIELQALIIEADPSIRPLVFRSLAKLGTPLAVDVLLEALAKPALRDLARSALARLARRDLGAHPEAWRSWFRGAVEADPLKSSGALPKSSIMRERLAAAVPMNGKDEI